MSRRSMLLGALLVVALAGLAYLFLAGGPETNQTGQAPTEPVAEAPAPVAPTPTPEIVEAPPTPPAAEPAPVPEIVEAPEAPPPVEPIPAPEIVEAPPTPPAAEPAPVPEIVEAPEAPPPAEPIPAPEIVEAPPAPQPAESAPTPETVETPKAAPPTEPAPEIVEAPATPATAKPSPESLEAPEAPASAAPLPAPEIVEAPPEAAPAAPKSASEAAEAPPPSQPAAPPPAPEIAEAPPLASPAAPPSAPEATLTPAPSEPAAPPPATEIVVAPPAAQPAEPPAPPEVTEAPPVAPPVAPAPAPEIVETPPTPQPSPPPSAPAPATETVEAPPPAAQLTEPPAAPESTAPTEIAETPPPAEPAEMEWPDSLVTPLAESSEAIGGADSLDARHDAYWRAEAEMQAHDDTPGVEFTRRMMNTEIASEAALGDVRDAVAQLDTSPGADNSPQAAAMVAAMADLEGHVPPTPGAVRTLVEAMDAYDEAAAANGLPSLRDMLESAAGGDGEIGAILDQFESIADRYASAQEAAEGNPEAVGEFAQDMIEDLPIGLFPALNSGAYDAFIQVQEYNAEMFDASTEGLNIVTDAMETGRVDTERLAAVTERLNDMRRGPWGGDTARSFASRWCGHLPALGGLCESLYDEIASWFEDEEEEECFAESGGLLGGLERVTCEMIRN